MKMTSVLVGLAVVLAVIGAGLSYTGYNESLQSLTVTGTRSFTVTSLTTVASISTESAVMTTISTDWLLQEEVIDLPAGGQAYCGYYGYRILSLDAGQVHVSYHTDGRPVSFWLLNERDFQRWKGLRGCEQPLYFKEGVAFKFKSGTYEFTTAVPSTGEYYFLFFNDDKSHGVVVTLNVDAGTQQTEYTVTNEHTVYSTEQTIYPTQTMTFSTEPVGIGALFYSGIGLIVVAVVLLGVSRIRGSRPSSAPVPTTRAAQPAPTAPAVPSLKTAGKFCINCGAPLPVQATFCNKCGSRQ
jgi:ribosomal protein L40E